ncbi:hypothetical protein ACFV6M_17535 [Streptomyces californicus]|uniref:hypothetical protein n=1 Tax=Streptomyces TaxID=1883 RepID=UPI0004C0A905|nr:MULTISPECIES: hypothetical protein [Streptomyces]NEA12888.1 hypothetical protein [Streptomyces sp. SID10692]
MDTLQNTALTRALTELPGPLPARGVIHIAIRHTDRFTVVGNHLAQHANLSTIAVGLAVRIQSLPQGTEVGVKALAARLPEGEKLIAAALRELEAHGYLQRARTRLPNGRIVTRTVFCNQPAALLRPRTAPTQPPPPAVREIPAPPPVQAHAPERDPAPPQAPAPESVPPPATTPPHAAPRPGTQPAAPPFVPLVPAPTAPKPPPRPLPQPHASTPELHRAATAFLADLRRQTPEFTLSEDDIHRLAPAVAAWLEREARPDTIRRTLTTDLPQPLRHPAKFLRHRLTVLLPPRLPEAHELTPHPSRPRATVTPFQTCDGCERAFRAPTPGHCRDCRNAHAQPAQTAA